jgi:carbon-monoxide dehydrogenase medium subunit
VWSGRCGFAIEEFARRHGDFAVAGAAVAVEVDADDRISRCGIGLIGLASTPLRASAAEGDIAGRPIEEIAADDLGTLVIDALEDVPSDLQGSSAYRRRVGAVMVARAWMRAIAEATGG